jgi:acylphosphatase
VSVIRHVVFRGRVQGVGFRAFVEHQAMQFGVEGWVRNRRDGVSVEAVFAGAAETVDAVIDACRKGPPHGQVDAIDQRDGTAEELALRKQVSFAVLPTV